MACYVTFPERIRNIDTEAQAHADLYDWYGWLLAKSELVV
jgi:hypothetical protein